MKRLLFLFFFPSVTGKRLLMGAKPLSDCLSNNLDACTLSVNVNTPDELASLLACEFYMSLISLSLLSSELDGGYPPYIYSDLGVDGMPLEAEMHEQYMPEMVYDPRQAYPEPL